MPVGGKLVLKGGGSLKPNGKKQIRKRKAPNDEDQMRKEDEAAASHVHAATTSEKPQGGKPAAVGGITTKGKSYEEEFEFEKKRIEQGQKSSTPWGSSYRAAPAILHGYDKAVSGKTAEERLDMRAATKTDRFCK